MENREIQEINQEINELVKALKDYEFADEMVTLEWEEQLKEHLKNGELAYVYVCPENETLDITYIPEDRKGDFDLSELYLPISKEGNRIFMGID